MSVREVQGFNSTYFNYKQSVKCKATKVFKPSSVERVAEIVFEAVRNGMNVKAVGQRFSSSRIICTEGYALDMSDMNTVQIDENAKVVTAGAGAKLQDIYTALQKKKYALKVSGSRFSGKL